MNRRELKAEGKCEERKRWEEKKGKKSSSGKQKGKETDSSDSGDEPVLDDDYNWANYGNELP